MYDSSFLHLIDVLRFSCGAQAVINYTHNIATLYLFSNL